MKGEKIMTTNQKLFKYEKVNWYDEELDDYYEDENDGRVFGIYTYEGEDIIDVTWYKSENERDDEIERRDTT
jgi:hypothetical protein